MMDPITIVQLGDYLFHEYFSDLTKTSQNPLRRTSIAHSFLQRKSTSETGYSKCHSPGGKPGRAARHSCSSKLTASAAAGPGPAAAACLLGGDLDTGLEQADIGLVQAETLIETQTKTTLQTPLPRSMFFVFLKAVHTLNSVKTHLGDIAQKVYQLMVLNELQHCLGKRQLQKQVRLNEYALFTHRSPTHHSSLRKDRDSDKTPLNVINLKLFVILCPQRPSMEDHVIERQP